MLCSRWDNLWKNVYDKEGWNHGCHDAARGPNTVHIRGSIYSTAQKCQLTSTSWWHQSTFAALNCSTLVCTGIRRLTRGLAIFPQGNWEPLIVRCIVGRPTGDIGVRKSMECDTFPFCGSTLLVGWQEGIRPVWVSACWWRLTGALPVLSFQLSLPPPSSSAAIKSRLETFRYQLTWVDLENVC